MVGDDAEWHSSVLYYVYQLLGWFAFTVWSISFYPQVILNYRRKRFILFGTHEASSAVQQFHRLSRFTGCLSSHRTRDEVLKGSQAPTTFNLI